MNGSLIWCRNLLLAFSILLALVPVTFILNALLIRIGAVLLAKPTPLPVVKVAFVNHLSFEILVPTKSIKFSIFEHASINEVFCLQYPVAIEVSAVELACIDFLLVTCKEILAVASHLTIDPLAFVPLPWGDDELDTDSILLSVAKLALVNIAIVVSNFTNALNLVVSPDTLKNVSRLRNEFANSVFSICVSFCDNFSLKNVPIALMNDVKVFAVSLLRAIHVVIWFYSISVVDPLEEVHKRPSWVWMLVLILAKVLRSLLGGLQKLKHLLLFQLMLIKLWMRLFLWFNLVRKILTKLQIEINISNRPHWVSSIKVSLFVLDLILQLSSKCRHLMLSRSPFMVNRVLKYILLVWKKGLVGAFGFSCFLVVLMNGLQM